MFLSIWKKCKKIKKFCDEEDIFGNYGPTDSSHPVYGCVQWIAYGVLVTRSDD